MAAWLIRVLGVEAKLAEMQQQVNYLKKRIDKLEQDKVDTLR